jgi:hypothetical protein
MLTTLSSPGSLPEPKFRAASGFSELAIPEYRSTARGASRNMTFVIVDGGCEGHYIANCEWHW